MKYESTILKRLIDTYGVVGNPRYISEIIKEFIVRGKERFPNLFTYQSDWLAHIDEFGLNPTYTVSYTGQSIYAPNTLERPVKSAILKGQTLVNNMCHASYRNNRDDIKPDSNGHFINDTGLVKNILPLPTTVFKTNTTYTIILILDEIYDGGLNETQTFVGTYTTLKLGVNKKVFTSPSTFDDYYTLHNTQINGNFKARYMILEGDYTNVDIPYFEGMTSVKMPVLSTTGKNLFDGELEVGYISDSGNAISQTMKRSVNFISVKPNTSYVFSTNLGETSINFMFYDENKNFITTQYINKTTTPNNCYYIRFYNSKGDYELNDFNIQIEEGSVATPYEPYKTNILSCLEPVELGSVGEVKDELNLLTQQLTQRTETRPYQEGDELNSEFVTDMTNTHYKLAQEVVKTVDLNIKDQNNQMVNHLTSFEGGTHFDTSSQTGSVLPTLEVDVVVDLEETLTMCSTEGNTM